MLASAQSPHVIPLNHNRDVAMFDGERLNELGFRGLSFTTARGMPGAVPEALPRDEDGIRDAASVFQLGYSLYTSGRYAAR